SATVSSAHPATTYGARSSSLPPSRPKRTGRTAYSQGMRLTCACCWCQADQNRPQCCPNVETNDDHSAESRALERSALGELHARTYCGATCAFCGACLGAGVGLGSGCEEADTAQPGRGRRSTGPPRQQASRDR